MSRAQAALSLVVLILSCACATPPPETLAPAGRPPPPRIDDTSGRDPLDEAPARSPRERVPLPPIADPGELPAATGLPSPSGLGATLYVIGDREISAAALGDFILRYFPDRVRDPLGQLVDEALVEIEVARQGVSIAPELVAERANAHIEARRKEVRVEYGADASLEDLLASSFGRSIEEFQQDAQRLARIALLRDRLVRLDQLRVDRVEVRALTFADQKAAESAATRLATGADMTLLARRLGLRPPVAPPPFARDEITPPERAEQVFAAQPGEVLEPRAFTGSDGRTWYEVIKVVAKTQARTEPWERLRDEIAADVVARPVGVPEYLAWRRRTIRRAGVEIRRAGRGLVQWLDQPPPVDTTEED